MKWSLVIQQLNDIVILKLASYKDKQFLLDLANDKSAIEASNYSKLISKKDHNIWFENKINSSKCIIMIAYFNKEKVGAIRTEQINNKHIISITVTNKFRRKNIAFKILSKFCQKNIKYIAIIKKTNKASLELFKKAGFKFLSENNENNEITLKLN